MLNESYKTKLLRFEASMTIIFGAGGTAGHVFMAMGIAKHVKCKKILITDQRGIKYLPKDQNYFDQVHILPVASFKVFDFWSILKSFFHSLKILGSNKGCTYFGCGAYSSLIVGMAAIILRKEIHIYQGDQIIGRANKFLQHFSKISWVSSDNLELKNKYVVGCITRDCITYVPMQNDGKFRILVLGSSIGTRVLELILPEALSKLDKNLLQKIEIIQQNREPAELLKKYRSMKIPALVEEFVDSAKYLPKSHLVISRAGWSLISDLITAGRASILIPWSDAKDNHQYYNAKWLGNTEWMIEEEFLDACTLSNLIEKLAKDMFEQNAGLDYIKYGILADRSKYLRENFSANAGAVIGRYLSS